MSQQFTTKPNTKKLVKLLTKTIKEVVVNKEIHPTTRKGNKELSLLVKQIAKSNLCNKKQAIKYGEQLGEVIVEFSQKNQKKYLDKGVLRQIALQKQLPSLPEITPETTKAEKPIVEEKAASKEVSKPVENLFESEPETLVPEEKSPSLDDSEFIENLSESEPETLVPEEKSPSLDDSEFIENLSESEPEILVPEEKSPSLDDSDTTKKSSQTQDSNSMSLKDRISEDIKLAMKAKDKIRLETVRSIKKALIEKEVAVRPTGQDSLTQEQELELLSQQAKQRRDSIEQYRNGGRDDLADKEAQELAIIETYLPKQLSDEEIGAVVDEIITSVGATTVKDLGKVMGAVMQQLKGKADGKKIQTMVKSKLEAK
jgi:hypothetical protein